MTKTTEPDNLPSFFLTKPQNIPDYHVKATAVLGIG